MNASPGGCVPCIFVVLALSLASSPGPLVAAGAGADVSTAAAPVFEENLWSVSLNGQDRRETVLFLRDAGGRVLAGAKDLERWRFRLPAAAARMYQDEAYYPLDGLDGVSYRIDEPTQTIAIEAPGEVFLPVVVSGVTESPAATPSSLGGFFNYDGFIQYNQDQLQLNALTEAGVYNRWGVGTATLLWQDLTETKNLVRLDSTWTTDRPESMASVRFGDAISQPGEWGGAARFGGIQWATNFSTQPRFIPFPMPAVAGEAILPSTVDVYVNNLLQMRTEVPAGPFSITDLPVMTGQGDARVVVRDLLGREQIITQPFYVSPQLLSEGTQQYSYETGLIRRNYGLTSFDYASVFASGTHRYGFSNRLTGEVHGELMQRQQTFGLSGSYLWSDLGVFNLALGGSHSDFGSSPFAVLGFQRQGRWFGISVRTRIAGRHFTQLGLQPGTLASREISNVSGSLSLGPYGSFSLSYIRQDNRDRADVSFGNAAYNVSLGRFGALNLSYFRSLEGLPDDSVALTFTFSLSEMLGGNTSASLSATALQDNEQGTLQIQRSLPRGTGFGYQLLASQGVNERFGASVSLQNNVGLYNAEVSHVGEQTGYRGSVSGGVALTGASWPQFSRRLTNSFAVVRVPGIADVRVYADNQLAGVTDADGEVLIPQMRAYQKNPVRIEQADLPFDAQFSHLELEAVPYFRSGLELSFPVKRSRGALFTLVLEDGSPMPSGALVQINGEGEAFPVALRGEVFVTGLQAENRLRATWRGQSCEFAAAFPETDDPLPNLGSFTCSGVKP
ncbi:MAG: fimbria/pilus outer membrane usher protein [Gammaproteobacteria bacterium]